MTTSGQMAKWSIELNEYSLEFKPTQSIKAQALANFVVECSFYNLQDSNLEEQLTTRNNSCQLTHNDESDLWSVYIDGLSAREGVRILLIRPGKGKFRYSIKFMFLITNSVTEYEALLEGFRLAKKIRVEKLTVFANS